MDSKVVSTPPHAQYLDLFRSQRDLIDRHAPALLNSKRDLARDVLEEVGIPRRGSEEYQRTDLESLFEKDFGLNLNRIEIPLQREPIYSCDITKDDLSVKSSVVNDDYRQMIFENAKRKLPQTVFVGSIAEFARLYPQLAQQYYARAAYIDQDGAVALNTLLVQDAFVLYLPKGVRVEQPIHLIQLLNSGVDLLCNRRWLIIVEEEASASLLVCDHTVSNVDFLINQVVEIYVGRSARFELYDLEENSRRVARVSSVFLRQEEESHVVIDMLTLNNGITRNNIRTRFLGPRAQLSVAGLGVGGVEQHIDNLVRVEHTVPECNSNQLFKYILSDSASGAFSGRIFVANGAQKTEAFQNNRNLLLSPKTKMYSKPQLEIYADDVKCTHGLATGELDQDALFYMQQRGIPADKAKVMLSIAFADDVIRTIPLESLREKVYSVIESRFGGNPVRHCSQCNKLMY